MIRQRLPFWMYSLEELRCDLTAFHQAGELAHEFPFAEYVQYGVLFDRLFRFPLTGGRVRNYDGLAGQILFGYLHGTGILTWRNNTLTIDWERLPEGVDELRLEIEALYRTGISSSKVRYWIAAHDLVSKYVQPNLGSQWTPEARAGRDEADHKAWVNLVNPDEFPLSMFYQSLGAKLLPTIEASSGGSRVTPLAGRRVLVTGAAGGLGPSVVAAADAAGARLILVDVAQERLDALAADFTRLRIESTHVVDLLDDDAVRAFAAEVTRSAPVDAVWHLVGGWRGGTPLQEQPLEDWEWLHDLLVRTTVHVARAFAEPLAASDAGAVRDHLRQGGAGTRPARTPPTRRPRRPSEAVVLALANGFKGTTATANVVVVPAILTPAMREKNPDKDWGVFVPAEEIADALVYLSSPAGAKMNGQRIRLYSGGPS